MLTSWSYDELKPAPPWQVTFTFEPDAIRVLEMQGDPRLESIRFLETRAQQSTTLN